MSRSDLLVTSARAGRADALMNGLQGWWAQRAPRERRLLRLGAAAVLAALLWWAGLEPAIRSIADANERLPRLRHDAAQLDALLLEAQHLERRRSGRLASADMEQALAATLVQSALDAETILSAPDDSAAGAQWEVRFHDVGAGVLMEWLAGLPAHLPVAVVSVDLSRSRVEGRDRPGHVSGKVLLKAAAEGTP